MTELEKRTTIVPATSFDKLFNPAVKDIETVYADLIKFFELNNDEVNKLKLSAGTEKLGKSSALKIMLSMLVLIIDEHKKPESSNKNDEAIYLANKKITKELLFSLFTILNNYQYSDRELKIQLMGKVLQSLYGIQ